MNDIRQARTLTPKGVARVLALAMREVFTDPNAKIKEMCELLQDAEMALSLNDKPHASAWCEDMGFALEEIMNEEKQS